jgi:hypothetical protein
MIRPSAIVLAAVMIAASAAIALAGDRDDCKNASVLAKTNDGNVPATKVYCPQSLIGDYISLTLTDGAGADNAHSVAAAAETEIRMSPKLRNWTQELNRGMAKEKKDLTVGCDFGGTVTASGDKDYQKYSFAGCAW